MRNSFLKATALTTFITFGAALAPFAVAQAGRPSGPQGGDAEANSSSRSSSNSTSTSQGGAGGSSGGNSFNNRTHIEAGGGVAGAPGMGLAFLASACNNSFGVSVGGGSPFVFSLGAGVQWADVAGVYLPSGATVGDYLMAKEDKRVEMVEGLSTNDKNKLACLVNVWEQSVMLLKARGEFDITIAAIDGMTKVELEKIRQSGALAGAYMDHICNNKVLVIPKDYKVDPETRAIRSKRGPKRDESEEGHENCAKKGEELIGQGILNNNYLTGLNNLLEQRQKSHPQLRETVPEHTHE
jgi:hypothetical protein